jgi:homocitrate synthase
VASKIGLSIPFNHYIVGTAAFTHKAGVHTQAVLNHPKTYEAIDPSDFGLVRSVLINHKLTGKHAIAHRARQLGLDLDRAQIQAAADTIESLADGQYLAPDKVDEILALLNQGMI